MLKEIRDGIANNKVTIGVDSTLKNLRSGNLDTVLVTQNCPSDVLTLIETLQGDAKVVKLEQKNDELGVMCKKPFSISVLGFLK